MNIKVCGITQLKQLQQLDGLNIDFAGLIFYKESPRYMVGKISKEELQSTDFDVKKVGVFVNAGYDEIMQTIEDYGLDAVQLHGNETPELCEQLSDDAEVIKAFGINETTGSVDKLVADYDEVCDYYLFDTKAANGAAGGTGKKFDWSLIKKSKIEKPFFLSGGLSLEDAAKIKAFKHPDFMGIDINSKFEKEPGIKDMALVLQLKQALK
jgi:phosphoribosylanthranilate isomerase